MGERSSPGPGDRPGMSADAPTRPVVSISRSAGRRPDTAGDRRRSTIRRQTCRSTCSSSSAIPPRARPRARPRRRPSGRPGAPTRRACKDAGAFVSGEPLEAPTTATTVAVRNGERVVTDGPFAETKEWLGGYYVIEAADLDAALDHASAHPERRLRPRRGAAGDAGPRDVSSAVERAFREESGRVLATLIRHLGGDFQLAEDALQDAFAVALATWPRDGVPANPGAWITTAARRKAIDRLRRERAFARPPAHPAHAHGARPPRGGPRSPRTSRLSTTTACASSSPAVTPRWRWTRASR